MTPPPHQVLSPRPSRYRVASLLFIALALATYLVGGGSVQLWDRDEAWYAQSSRQMLESGDWVVTRFLDQPRYSKPILIYWSQAACMKVLGPTPRAARLPSALGMAGTLILLAVILSRTVGARRAFLTVLVFGSSAMIVISAKMCLTDAVLLLFLTSAQLCLFRMYWLAHREHKGQAVTWHVGLPVLFWISVGLAGLTKGPIVLAILLATLAVLAVFDRKRLGIGWWRRLRPLWGAGIIAAMLLPWLGAAYLKDPAFLKNMLLEPVRHTTTNQDGQSPLPGYYLIAIWPTFFPWSFLLPMALVSAIVHRRTPHIRFALATILGNWLFAEVMVTKLPHYLLPSFSSLAFLTAAFLIRAGRGAHRGMLRWLGYPFAGIWMLGAIALALVPWIPASAFDRFPTRPATAFSIVALVYIASVLILFLRRRLFAAAATMGFGMLMLIGLLWGLYFPAAWFLRMPADAGQALRELHATSQGQVIMTGFIEPSLAFYQGGTIREPDAPDFLQAAAPESWPRFIVTTQRLYDRLPPERRSRLRVLRTFQGLDYNAGAKADLYARVNDQSMGKDPIAPSGGLHYNVVSKMMRIETVLILEKL